jgi:hypothetical protein
MSGIILQGKSLKVVNHGGGHKCSTKKINKGRYVTRIGPREKGTDYIVFECPGCGQRNKRSAYEAKGSSGESISFKCHRCYREIEVARPESTKIILGPNSSAKEIGLLGPDGKPIRS